MTLLKQSMAEGHDRERAAIERSARLATTVTSLGTEVHKLDERVRLVEEQSGQNRALARAAMDSHDELKGSVMLELGKIGANDRAQNSALDTIRTETRAQTATLAGLVSAESTRATREAIVFWMLTKGVPIIWGATVAMGGVIAWVATHWSNK